MLSAHNTARDKLAQLNVTRNGINRIASEEVMLVLQLIKSKYFPALLYSLEECPFKIRFFSRLHCEQILYEIV